MSIDRASYLIHYVRHVDLTGTIIWCNSSVEQVTGYTVEETIGTKIWDICEDERELDACKDWFFDSVRKQPIPPVPVIQVIRKKDNSVVRIQCDWNYIRDSDSKVIGFMDAVIDVTEYDRVHNKMEKIISHRTSELIKANNILLLASEISNHILSDNPTNIPNILTDIANKLDLEDVFICYRNGTVNYAKSYKIKNGECETVEQKIEIEKCACLRDENNTEPFTIECSQIPNEKKCVIHSLFGHKDKKISILPVSVFDSLWGVMGFSKAGNDALSDFEIQALGSLARLIAVIINNKETQDIIREHIKNKFKQINLITEKVKVS